MGRQAGARRLPVSGALSLQAAGTTAFVVDVVSSSITTATTTTAITITLEATAGGSPALPAGGLDGWSLGRSLARSVVWRPPSALALHGVSAHLGTRQGDTAFVEEGLLCITLSTCCLSSSPFFTFFAVVAASASASLCRSSRSKTNERTNESLFLMSCRHHLCQLGHRHRRRCSHR